MDQLAPILSGSRFKVLAFIWRKLQGWHKDSDRISIGQIRKGVGVSRATACEAVRLFENAGLIGVRRKEGPRKIMRIFPIREADPAEVTRSVAEQVKFTGKSLSEWPDQFAGRTLTCSSSEHFKPGAVRSANTQKIFKENTKDDASAPPLPPAIPKPENPELQPATAETSKSPFVASKSEDPATRAAREKCLAEWSRISKSRSP